MVRPAITRSLSLDVPADRLLTFLANPRQWPNWAHFDLVLQDQLAEHAWRLRAAVGEAQLELKRNPPIGLVTYTFRYGQHHWSVPCRVLVNEGGCEFLITLIPHESLSDARFFELARLVEEQLHWLGKLMLLK